MKSILFGIAAITVVSIPAIPVQAAQENYSFDIEFTTGDLANQTFTGMFTLEYTLGFDGAYYPVGSTQEGAGGLLSWMIEINNETFDITDDDEFPDFPGVFFDGIPLDPSNFVGMSFLGTGSGTSTLEIVDFDVSFGVDNEISQGVITQVSLKSVPESSTILGLLTLSSLGLVAKINKPIQKSISDFFRLVNYLR